MAMRRNERGNATISAVFWLAVLGAAIYAAFNVIPVYVAHYELQDKMVEVCRLGRSMNPDDKILEMLLKKVREEGLTDWVRATNFQIITSESNRRIRVDYDREVKILPGIVRKQRFSAEADQPLAF
jgi:uncharacterized membrane protein